VDEMLVALAVGQLHKAQTVAARHQSHGFGIDGDRPIGESDLRGQVILVKVNRQFSLLDQASYRFSPARARLASPVPI
jgi:hypothetical protein